MGRLTAKRKTTAQVDEDVVDLSEVSPVAANQFWFEALNMGWRLALAVVIPLVGGYKIDQQLGSSPAFTLTGMLLAAGLGCLIVWLTVKELTAEQADQDKPKRRNYQRR